jgi:hypothetical protein
MLHVQVQASVTQPERLQSRVTNTFNFVFRVDLRRDAEGKCLPLIKVLPGTGEAVLRGWMCVWAAHVGCSGGCQAWEMSLLTRRRAATAGPPPPLPPLQRSRRWPPAASTDPGMPPRQSPETLLPELYYKVYCNIDTCGHRCCCNNKKSY